VNQYIYTLMQLQAMTPEQLIAAFPQKMSQWVRKGYLVDFNSLIEAVILATKAMHYPLSDQRGCREVWYNPIKPILLKIERKRSEKYMKTFEAVLAKMVKEGRLAYADLGINEFRMLKETYNVNQNQAQCWSNILLFVEKDAVYVHLLPLQELFNINILSGGGWSKGAGIEHMLRLLQEKGITEVVIFSLTDYDPFGFAIDQEFVSKCQTFGLTVSKHYRIGVNVEHATPEILDVQKYPIKRGRKLSCEGIDFNSDKWLAKYGIEGAYGLEIEAISAQPQGHDKIREIVATELLKYLSEVDRINEIVTTAWNNAPKEALQSLMYAIDNCDTSEEDLAVPQELPTEYLSYDEYSERVSPIESEMEKKTEGIADEIAELEDQLSDLEQQKENMEKPYQDQIEEIQWQYTASRQLLTSALWILYNEKKEKWTREKYDLGFPQGCLVQAVKEKKNLNAFKQQLDTKQIILDIKNGLQEAIDNGSIEASIQRFLKREPEP
jgi:hypothetical protein